MQGYYRWAPEIESEVRRGFDHKAGIRLKDLHNYIVKKKKGVCPTWMSLNVHGEMMKNAAEDQAFRTRSQTAARNRRGGELDTPIQPSHCLGSISTTDRAKRLAKERGGILPTAPELYLDTHMRDVEGKGKVPISDRAQQIKDAYERRLALSQESGSDADPNQVYYEVVGGRKKGIVPGLGTSGDLYYERSARRSGGSHSSVSTPSVVAQLSQRLADTTQRLQETDAERVRLERERVELERRRLEIASKEREEYIARLEQSLQRYEDIFSRCSGSFPFPPPGDPRDPPGAGGSGACPV